MILINEINSLKALRDQVDEIYNEIDDSDQLEEEIKADILIILDDIYFLAEEALKILG